MHGVVSKWIGIEHAVERASPFVHLIFLPFALPLSVSVCLNRTSHAPPSDRVKSLIAPDEPLTPGLLYVGVASLTGSILARNRSIFSRALLPPTLFYLSFKHFLPKTTQNVSTYAGSLEEKHFPTLAQKHTVAIAHSRMTWERLREAGIGGRDKFQDGLGSAVRKVQELTGLKVEEALGHKTSVANVVEKVEEALQSTHVPPAEARQSTGKAVEEKAEDGKRRV